MATPSARPEIDTYEISSADAQVLRALAERLADLAALPEQADRIALWRTHNGLGGGRPLVVLELEEPSWREALAGRDLRCESEEARRLESSLAREIWRAENIRDDWPIEAVVDVPITVNSTGWGVETKAVHADTPGGSAHYEPVLEPGDPPERIRTPQVSVDWEATRRRKAAVEEAIGDLLDVRLRGCDNAWFTPMDMMAQWRGVENFMADLALHGTWLHEMLARILECQLGWLEQMAEQGGLTSNAGAVRVASGGCGVTDELDRPDADGRVRPDQMWGHAAAQIFTGVSPDMHAEYALRYERPWLERFGLGSYGCCEALDDRVELLRSIPNLRRISMSPWVDVARGAAEIGSDYIFSRKPNPAILAGERWSPERARDSIRRDLERTRGCQVELIMRTIRTCRNEPHRLTEWVKIAMQEAEKL
jgi:hypothetical protein